MIVDGTTIGATTDLDGSFSVRIGARTDVRLIVSYLGLKTREVAVDDPARFYEVRLENDNMALDEVVVVGYGTQRRSLVTNAISQFKPTGEHAQRDVALGTPSGPHRRRVDLDQFRVTSARPRR